MPHCSFLDPWWRARDLIPSWCWFSERDFLPTCFSKIPQEHVWGYIFSFITLGTQWNFSVWTLLFFNSGKFIMSVYAMPSAWFYFYWLLVLYWTSYVVPSGPFLFTYVFSLFCYYSLLWEIFSIYIPNFIDCFLISAIAFYFSRSFSPMAPFSYKTVFLLSRSNISWISDNTK